MAVIKKEIKTRCFGYMNHSFTKVRWALSSA